jgi:uncharacterized membrane protein
MPPVARQQQTTRLETFVDAAFAFALTMLVISVDAIPQSFEELSEALKGVPAFAASFAIVVMFWHGHYRWSRRHGFEDGTSVVLSLLLVFLVLVFLYPLRLMMSGALNAMSGGWLPAELEITQLSHLRMFFGLYGFAFALMSAVLVALNAHVLRRPAVPPLGAADRVTARIEIEAWTILASMGAISAAMAVLLPPHFVGLSVWLYVGLAVIMPLMGMRWRRVGAAAAAHDRSERA